MVKRGVSLCIAFVTMALFLIPCCKVYAEVTEEQNFYHWWVVEKTTEDYNRHHGGGGFGFNAAAEMEDIATKYGLSTEQIIHNFCNITTEEYEEFIKENYGVDVDQVFNDMFYNTPLTPETRQLYATSRANRVDNDGNINVSGSNFWRSVYNQLFSGGGYKDVYKDSPSDTWNGTSNGMTYSISIVNSDNTRVNGLSNTFIGDVFDQTYRDSIISFDGYASYFVINDNGNIGYINIAEDTRYRIISNIDNMSINGNILTINYTRTTYYTDTNDIRSQRQTLRFRYTTTDTPSQNQGVPVKQPSQVGFIKYPLGQKTPVYTPDSGEENPFDINDNGTVSMDEDDNPSTLPTTYPVWVNPDELSDDGWKLIFKQVNDDDNTDSPVNPYSKPWNTTDDGTILGGLFSNLIKDIGSLFSSIGDAIKKVIDNILNIPKFISDALKSFFNIDYDAMTDFDTDIDFDIITIIFNKLLELLGVT